MPPTEVRPQTFDSTSRFHKLGKPQHGSTSFQSPDSASPAVRLEKFKLTLRSEPAASQAAKERRPREWLKDFPLASSPAKNPISSVFEVLRSQLGFHCYKPILQ